MKKRILSVLMVLCLVLAAVPTALAGEEDTMPESPGEEAGETTPEGAAPNGDTAPEDGNGETTTPDGGDGETQEETRDTAPSPVNDVAVQAEGDVPQVTMDNMLVEMKSQGQKMSYSIESAEYADQIEFVELMQAENGELVENTAGNWGIGPTDHKVLITETDGSWSIQAPKQVVDEGQYVSTWVGAKYNEEIIASCEIQLIPEDSITISYTYDDGEAVGTVSDFATPVGVNASLVVNSTEFVALQNAQAVDWMWSSTAPEAVDVEVNGENPSKANVVIYQQKAAGNYTNISATPTIQLDGTEYVFTAVSSFRALSNRNDSIEIMKASSTNIWAGTTLTFEIVTDNIPIMDKNSVVTWSSEDNSLIPIPDGTTGTQIVVETPRKGFPSESGYTYINVSASITVGDHTIVATTSIRVWSNPVPVENPVSTYEELQNAIKESKTTVGVTNTIELNTGNDLDLTGITVMRPDSFSDALFNVIGDVTITGGDSGIIDGQYAGSAPLITVAETGDLTLENITLQNNHNNATGETKIHGGAINVEGGTLTCTDVTFSGNRVTYMPGYENSVGNFHGGGAIYAEDADLTVTSSNFSNDTAVYGSGGAIFVGDGTTALIKDNAFTNCTAEATKASELRPNDGNGGAIACGDDSFDSGMNVEIVGNTITGCSAEGNGGGIYVWVDNYNRTPVETLIGCSVTLDGNNISNCTAGNRGGGMSLYNTVMAYTNESAISLLSGQITGCEADWGGGIDYTGHGMNKLQLTNVIITGNEAGNGGGIWACPWAEVETYSTLGGAIYGNTAENGDDIFYEGEDSANRTVLTVGSGTNLSRENSVITVTSRALGGGLITWYEDFTSNVLRDTNLFGKQLSEILEALGGGIPYTAVVSKGQQYTENSKPANPALYTDAKLTFGIHGMLSEAWANAANTMQGKKLVIANNVASGSLMAYGGGIATNSPIDIGLENHDLTVTVEKVWSGSETHPASVNVTLVRKDEAGNTVDLETVTLSEDNEWTATFEDLPGLYEDENGTQHNYTYTVREDTIANWTGKVAETSEGNTIELVITNTYQPDPGPGGGGGTTTPDPDPDDKDDDDPEPTPTPTPTPNPDIPATPDNPDTPDTPNQPDTPSEPVSPSDPGVPQTSDTSLTGLWLALCLLALGGLGLLRFTQPRRGGRRARR